jgi:WD40 repeat protein
MDKHSFLISGSEDKSLKVWNMSTYECYKTIVQDIMTVSLLLLPNGYFATSFEDETMTIWNVKGFESINHIKSKEHQGIASMILLNDNRIVCSSYSTKLLVLEY